jgi:hypothetical protein
MATPWGYGAAEPVLETSRADARVIAGGEALIVQLYAEVKCVTSVVTFRPSRFALKNRRTSSSRRIGSGPANSIVPFNGCSTATSVSAAATVIRAAVLQGA